MSAAWPAYGLAPLLFIAWIPFLMLEDELFSRDLYKPGFVFRYSYLGFFLWNLLTTWWVYNASLGGAAMAIIFNSLFMAVVFMLYHIARRKTGFGFLVLASFWLTFEYIHLQWDITWPWLTIGNGFASWHKAVQWYEYTGVFGGGFWILAVNYLLFLAWKNKREGLTRKALRLAGSAAILVVVPVAISYAMYSAYDERLDPVDIVVVQPNIDPYNEKFNGLSPEEQLSKMLNLASDKLDTATDYLVFPETALTESIWENQLNDCFSVSMMRTFLQKLPNLNIVTGLSSNKAYENPAEVTETARRFRDADIYFDSFNTAMQLTREGEVQLYHKSKLVPGVEKMPFPQIFKPLEQLAIDLGGTTGSLGVQKERTVFFSNSKKRGVAPVICYESVYGEFVTDYVKNGAGLLFIITNDGWWGDTPGYRQHLSYAKLRAIETRRSIARSANTGVSCFIDQKGDVHQETSWWKEDAIKGRLNINNETTFYTRHGDFIARALSVFALFFIIVTLLMIFLRVDRDSLRRSWTKIS